ncbi:MAG: hypothetical protein JWO52_6918 [Gammaproteobacteria bacterium]|jgi:hypothetical protein|nr:hypothetical protein [Gammaproteobacteria bacterium]
MSKTQPAFVFVRRAWHNAATWRQVMPRLEARGFVARALDPWFLRCIALSSPRARAIRVSKC